MVELPDYQQISPIFNVSHLYDYHEFDAENEPVVSDGQFAQLPKKQRSMVQKVLDVKEVRS